MEQADADLIEENYAPLVRDMQTDVVIDHLISSRVLLRHQGQAILEKPNSAQRNRELLNIILATPASFDKFIAALKATTQYRLVELLQRNPREVAAAPHDVAANSPSAHGNPPDKALLSKLGNLNETQRKNALTKSLQVICDKLEIKEVLVIMEKAQAIRKVPAAQIMNSGTFYDQNRELVSHIQRSDQHVFLAFVNALLETDQAKIARTIADNAS